MKKIALITICTAFAATSFAQAPAKPAASSVSMVPVAAEVVVMTSTVDSVDVKKRIVTLKDDKGNTATMTVGKQINDLEKVKKGDLFVVGYAQALAVGLALRQKMRSQVSALHVPLPSLVRAPRSHLKKLLM